jgi:RimJ/RimL family protein N-acetyltransferase
MIIYSTDRLYVRSFVKADIEGNYKNWWDDFEITKYNSHGLFPYTETQMNQFLDGLESSENIIWAVVVKPSETKEEIHIGNISLQNINWINRSAEFAVIIGEREFWGKGYTTEAAYLLFWHGFNRLNLNRIYTGTASTNIGMQKVAEKLGMKKEGEFREGMFLNGAYTNIIEYGILKTEFKRLKTEFKQI